MSENHELGILREAGFGQKGYIKEDVIKYTKQLNDQIDELNKKVKSLEEQLEEANEKVIAAESAAASSKKNDDNKSSSSGGGNSAREKELENEVKSLTNKLNSTTITLKKLEEALQSEKQARQSEKKLYEAERGGVPLPSVPVQPAAAGASNEEVSELNKKLAEKEEIIKTKENLVQSKENMLKDKEKEIVSLKKTVAQKEQTISNLNEEVKNLKENSSASESEFKSSFDIGNVFIEAQNTAKKITLEAQAAADKLSEEAKEKAEATTKEAQEKSEQIIADADKKAKEIVEKAEEDVRNLRATVSNKVAGLDKLSEDIRSSFRNDLDKLKENLKSLSDAITTAEEGINKTVSEADKKIDDYSKAMFDKKALDEYIKTMPKSEPVKQETVQTASNNSNKPDGNNSKVSWAMDDLEALTKQVEITTGNQIKHDQTAPKNNNNKNAEKWKSDLAALAKEAEIDGV